MAGNIKLYKAGNYIIVEHADNQLTLPTTDSDYEVKIDRTVRQYNLTTQHLTARAATDSDELEVVTASGEFVIGAINHARLRDSSGSTFGGNRDAVVNAMNGSSLFGATLLESRVSANTSGRTTNAGNISTLQSDLDTAESNILNLQKALKFTANDRGVFLSDTKGLTQSYMRLQPSEFKLQAGTSGNTSITTTESSPGIQKFFVQAGATGSEASVEAMRISGSSTSNTKATVEIGAGTALLANGTLNVDGTSTLKNLSFSATGSPHTVSFSNASVTGLAASSIGSGTFANARISSASVLQHADNYGSWNLKTGGVQRTTVSSGGDLNLVGGTDISLAYSAGGTVTINSTATDTNTNLASTDLTFTGDRSITLDGNQLEFRSSSTANQDSLTVTDDGTVIVGPGSSQGAAVLRIREASANGSNFIALTVPDQLYASATLKLPTSTGLSGQYLKTDGTGQLSFATPYSLGTQDQTIGATRNINLGTTGDLRIKSGGSNTLTPFKVTANGSTPQIAINGDFRVDSGSLSGGNIRLEESPTNGSSYVQLQAPSSLSSNLTFTLPASDGTAGQFLKTDGSGNLSFATASGGGSTLTQVFTQSFIDDIATTTHYLPWKDINEQTTIYQEEAAFVMPYDGKIKQVTIRVATQVDFAGNFTVGVNTCPIGVSIFSSSNWTLEESEVLAFNGASAADDHHAFHFVFDNAKHFDAGDAVSISLSSSVDPGTTSYWYVTTIVEWDTTNGLGSSSTELTTNP